MSVKNLHSLIGSNWFINETYAQALLPSLMSILNGDAILVNTEDKPEAHIITAGSAIIDAADFKNTSNSEKYALVVSLKNPIYKYDQECGPEGTKTKQAIIASYESDPNCKGIVLDIDSGGGQVSGTPEFYDFLKNYSKPIVAYTDGLMCSAAYYIGSAASHIVANKRADAIGSIGALVSFIDFTGMYEKRGAKIIKAYASKSTEKNADFEKLLAGDADPYIKNQLDPIVEDFITDIKATRANVNDEVFKGSTYTAAEAMSLGLVDELGTIQTAINKVLELADQNEKSQKVNTKTMKNYNKIEALLGIETGFASNDQGVYLSEDQLQALEDQLATAGTDLQNVNDNLNTSIAEAIDVAGAVTEALEAAGVVPDENSTTLEQIAALRGLVLEYGKKPAASHTAVFASGDEQEVEDSNVIGGIDVSGAMRN